MAGKKTTVKHNLCGWKPDTHDHRDLLFAPPSDMAATLPASFDLRPQFKPVPVEDQGQLGSCTANAAAGMLEFLECKAGETCVDRSRLFIYWFERYIEGGLAQTKQDSGAQIRDAVKVMATYGACKETSLPYVVSRFTKQPPAACVAEAKKFLLGEYRRVTSIDDMKAALVAGYPVEIGFTVFQQMESAACAKTGIVTMPTGRQQPIGGHAVLVVGYDDSTERFTFRNSWGSGWGDEGYGYLPYGYFQNRNLSSDWWTGTSLKEAA
jgi:C1A family cysteine protease